MASVQSYCLLCLIILAVHSHFSVGKIVYDLKSWKNCSRIYKNYFRDFSLIRVSKEIQYVHTELVVTEPMSGFMNDWVVFHCKDLDGKDCKFFRRLRFNDGCGMMTDRNRPWTTLFNSSVPPAVCPLEKGVYRVTRGYIQTEFLENYGLNSSLYLDPYWLMKILAIVNRETLLCLEIVLKCHVASVYPAYKSTP